MKKLFEVKKEMPVIKKDANNPFFKSGYATLSNIIEVVEPILHKHGLFITHIMDGSTLITRLHEDGGVLMESKFALPVNGDIQKIGSAITYARRYNLVAMLNLNVEDDDDGNAVKPDSRKPPKTETISKECKGFVDRINEAHDLTALNPLAELIKANTKLTANDKDFLRNLYTERKAKLK